MFTSLVKKTALPNLLRTQVHISSFKICSEAREHDRLTHSDYKKFPFKICSFVLFYCLLLAYQLGRSKKENVFNILNLSMEIGYFVL